MMRRLLWVLAISVACRAWITPLGAPPEGAEVQVRLGAPSGETLSLLRHYQATFRVDSEGLWVKADAEGLDCLWRLFGYHGCASNLHRENRANANTTVTVDGSPFRPRMVELKEDGQSAVGLRPSPFRWVFDPTHPDALRPGDDCPPGGSPGYVCLPNIDPATEAQAEREHWKCASAYARALEAADHRLILPHLPDPTRPGSAVSEESVEAAWPYPDELRFQIHLSAGLPEDCQLNYSYDGWMLVLKIDEKAVSYLVKQVRFHEMALEVCLENLARAGPDNRVASRVYLRQSPQGFAQLQESSRSFDSHGAQAEILELGRQRMLASMYRRALAKLGRQG